MFVPGCPQMPGTDLLLPLTPGATQLLLPAGREGDHPRYQSLPPLTCPGHSDFQLQGRKGQWGFRLGSEGVPGLASCPGGWETSDLVLGPDWQVLSPQASDSGISG